ncbi:MAG TPA: S8 family serine peptidase [Candidatus Eisenbacteria bacterium]|nr:S8 family serine peptidase [Candidatus Eisenbacteria bacterium]
MGRLAIAAIGLLAIAAPALATFPYPAPPPGTPPQSYGAYLRLPMTVPPTRPGDFAGGDAWKLTSDQSGDPAIDASPDELFGVTGMSADLAWQVTTGRPDVLIAVLDSGIKWDDRGAMADLARKVHVNRHELPLPQNAAGQTKPAAAPGARNPDPYDLDDDGVLTAADYAADPRVGDRNANGVIDPEDLIAAFSDGVDGDTNGYVDDIAGWDFLDDDNDPFDDVSYGHGTGEARDSCAEADNGGDLGVCPNCMVMPVRVGDSFIADSNNFAQAVVFAVDSGAHVVQEALGAVNDSQFARDAIEYAYGRDVPVIASAADEESFHHNVPAANRHTITVNSVTKFTDVSGIELTPHSFLFLNGCTNYGGNIAVAIASSSCSSEATGRGSGIAGLLVSAALDAVEAGSLTPRRTDPTGNVHPLSANEVGQLLTMTADDIDFSSNRTAAFGLPGTTTVRYASQPGWDQYFGYGRAHAAHAVGAVAMGDIPPEADLLAPDWWTTLDPQSTPAVPITGSAAARRATSFGYELAFGCGVQPTEDRFHPIASASGVTSPLSAATLATWRVADAAATCAFDPAATPSTAPSGTASPNDTPDLFTITLRLRVVDDAGRTGESRRTVYVVHDQDLLPGFPVRLGGSGEASPLFIALKGHGKRAKENLLVATSDGLLHAYRPDGTEMKGWPVSTDLLPLHTGSHAFTVGALQPTYAESLGNGLAAADIDGDHRVEVVAGSLGGKLYVWDRKGRRRKGFPVTTDPRFSARTVRDRFNRVQRGLVAPPVLADLDSTPKTLEIVAAAMDRHVYVWRPDGSPLPGWPVQVVDRTQMAAIDPVSHKVTPKVVNGQAVALQGTKIVSTPAVGPLRGDGRPVIVVGTNEEYREAPNFAAAGNGTISLFINLGVLSQANGRVYAIPAAGMNDAEGATNPSGPYLTGWPARPAILADELLPWIEGVPGAPSMADVDGDGTLEVGISSVAGPAYLLQSDGSSFYGADAAGKPRTLPTDRATFGAASPTTDPFASVPSLGSGTFAPIGPGGTVAWIQTGAGFVRLLDAQLPAEQLPHDVHLLAWRAATGESLVAFPRLLDDLVFLGEPSVADISGDDVPEILVGSGGYLVHAIDASGTEPLRWPKFTGGWIIASPTVSQQFAKGSQVVAVTTREGYVWVWRSAGNPKTTPPWPRYHHDARNSGVLER